MSDHIALIKKISSHVNRDDLIRTIKTHTQDSCLACELDAEQVARTFIEDADRLFAEPGIGPLLALISANIVEAAQGAVEASDSDALLLIASLVIQADLKGGSLTDASVYAMICLYVLKKPTATVELAIKFFEWYITTHRWLEHDPMCAICIATLIRDRSDREIHSLLCRHFYLADRSSETASMLLRNGVLLVGSDSPAFRALVRVVDARYGSDRGPLGYMMRCCDYHNHAWNAPAFYSR